MRTHVEYWAQKYKSQDLKLLDIGYSCQAFNLWWKVYLIKEPKEKLGLVMDYFRQKSEERGLTQEILDDLLSDE